ncbi:MAG: NAD(+) synthase [Flavobacteriales bacterium]|nr:NAD(+) synthase [Flavobacteriales bacterium]
MNTQKVIKHISDWLGDYLKTSNCKGFVIGVSGGIDSAVTSHLAALTGATVWCIELPIYQHPNQINRARKHIETLQSKFKNVKTIEIGLSSVFTEFSQVIPQIEEGELKNLALANARARLRMTTLYYVAGITQSLVLGTGNKIEDFGVGFFTKYGDGGVDLSPIADLLKSEVYMLGHALEIIPEIMDAAPTDGLWGDDRTDEDQIGASYDELEWAFSFTERRENPAEIEQPRQREVLEIYTRLHKMNQHKMTSIPVCKIPSDLKV